jgi:predicted PurR-regulated permease PerM
VKIQNPFRLGLLATLGALVAIVIGGAIASLATVLTWVGAAIFLALGLDPLVSWLEKRKVARPIAILITLVVVLGIFTALVLALIPVIAEQVNNLTAQITQVVASIQNATFREDVLSRLPWLDPNIFDSIIKSITDFTSDPNNYYNVGGGVLGVALGVASGLVGAFVVIILVIYFTASLGSIKRGIYQLVPATKRPQFIDLAEQISTSVGRYVIGQVSLGLINGTLSLILLSAIGVKNAILLAFIAFLGSIIPLVGTLSASVIITLSTLLFMGTDWHLIVVGIWYLVYMQIEAYVIGPRIMERAVKVPGFIVVIAALVGGTLLGILGALVALPVAAAVQLIIREVVVPRQNEL